MLLSRRIFVRISGSYSEDNPLSALKISLRTTAKRQALPTAADRATYIRDTLAEIRKFADDEELVFLRYLLSMALEEANVSVVTTTTKHP